MAPASDDRNAALFGFDKEKGVAFRDDNASAADIGLEQTLALVGDTASAGSIDFEPFQAVTSPAPKTWTSRGKKPALSWYIANAVYIGFDKKLARDFESYSEE